MLISCSDDKKYPLYRCSYGSFSEQCNNACVIDNEFKTQFIVDKNSSSVLEIIYDKGEQSGSIFKDKCKIINNTNWDCSDDYSNEIRSVRKMANGIFSAYTDYGLKTGEGICSK